ncbi:MAG: hypothetical protein WCI45_03100 [Desulfuromonadales bacterium]
MLTDLPVFVQVMSMDSARNFAARVQGDGIGDSKSRINAVYAATTTRAFSSGRSL